VTDYIAEEGHRFLSDARERLETARQSEIGVSEGTARAALGLYAKALNYLEDTSDFEMVHTEMHEAGRWVRETFGCPVYQEGERYEQRCPVAVAHRRIGFSPEIIVREWHCSICNRRPEQCEHVTGRQYDGERCYQVITKCELVSVSIVSRPAQPEARLLALPLSNDDLREALPPEWTPGSPLSCDQCLTPCPGIEESGIGLHGVPPDDAP
jgi:hypothetical protein